MDNSYGAYVGMKIKALREARGWDESQLGAAAGSYNHSIFAIEGGYEPSGLSTDKVSLWSVADALEIPVYRLTEIDGPPLIHVPPVLYDVAMKHHLKFATVRALASLPFQRFPQTVNEWEKLYKELKPYFTDVGGGKIIHIRNMSEFVRGNILIDARDRPSPPSATITSAYFAQPALSSSLYTQEAQQALKQVMEMARGATVYIISETWLQQNRIIAATKEIEGCNPLFYIFNYGDGSIGDECGGYHKRRDEIFEMFMATEIGRTREWEFGNQIDLPYNKHRRNAEYLYRCTLNYALVDTPHRFAFVLVLGDMSAELTANVARVFKEKTGEYPLVVVGDQLVPINEVGGAV